MENIRCNHRPNISQLNQAGDFCFVDDRKTLILFMPDFIGLISLNLGHDVRPKWTLTGPDDEPTLSPSIVVGGWHGYLESGWLKKI